MAGWQDAPIVGAAPTAATAPAKGGWETAPVVEPAPKSAADKTLQTIKNLLGGVVGGSGETIGTTLVSAARDLGNSVLGAVPAGMRPEITAGATDLPQGDALSAEVRGGVRAAGGDPESLAYKGAKLGTEVAGTLGVGGALSKAAQASGMVAPVVKGLATGGLDVAGATGAAGVAARAGTGAVVGGASAGLVDPSSAGTGAVIGGAVPVVAKGVGMAAERAGLSAGRGGAPMPQQKLDAARAGSAEGYVVPPIDLQPGLLTRLASGLSGKIKTAQVASERNQAVTDRLAREALGLNATDELSADVLQALRQKAGAAYEAVRGGGTVTADPQFLARLDQIAAVSKGASRSFPGLPSNGVDDLIGAVRQPTFDAGDSIDAVMYLRDAADKAFRQGDTTLGRAAKNAATAIEDQLERHLIASGKPEAVNAFRQARQQIAKTYSVQGALNTTTGSVSAPKLARDLQKGKPLSGELETVARFSDAFPKASQALKEAPGTVSPLDWLFAGGTSMGVGSPLGAATLLARPAARAALLSKPVQERALADPTANALAILFSEKVGPAGLRALPVLAADQ